MVIKANDAIFECDLVRKRATSIDFYYRGDIITSIKGNVKSTDIAFKILVQEFNLKKLIDFDIDRVCDSE